MPLNNLLSQEDLILAFLKSGNSITPLEALERWGVFRLSGRIYSLKKKGYNIHMKLVGDKKKYAQYSLKKEEKQLVIPI